MSASPPVPAVLRLVQAAVLGRWHATADELYREVARLVEAHPGREIAVAGCGDGRSAEWLARRTGASITGVDPDPARIEAADERLRPAGVLAHFQPGPLEDLPLETAVFDAAIGEPPLSAAADPARAVAELARVTRPMGIIVLLQPSWTTDVPPERRELIVERLGLRPHLVVEWKQMLRDAGVVDIQVQDWTSGQRGGRPTPPTPLRLARLGWRQKLQIAGRAWTRGWQAARSAVEREAELLHELSRERAIGFQVIRGVKWPHESNA